VVSTHANHARADHLDAPNRLWVSSYEQTRYEKERKTMLMGKDLISEDKAAGARKWVRRDELQGRPVDTLGGTKVGNIGDVVLEKDGGVQGFSLGRVHFLLADR
jgi:hypothetical protein